MRYHAENDDEAPGQDSFLDIVANIVGILIILVMVVGVRASHAPLVATTEDAGSHEKPDTVSQILPSDQDHEADRQEAAKIEMKINASLHEVASLQNGVSKLAARVVMAEREEIRRNAERIRLQAMVDAAREEIELQREKLTDAERAEFDVQRRLDASREKLEELMRAQYAIEESAPEVETVECLPTPLAKTVLGDEIHVRIRKGRVAVIPLDSLLEVFKHDAEAKASRIGNRSRVIETVGPIDGFRLRYRLVRQPFSVQSNGGSQQGAMITLDRWEILPVVDDLGVPVDQVLLPGSKLSNALASASPDHTTVTIWTYPDSFEEFRSLKKSLFEMGFSAAARPLPVGIRIGGSPQGTKSSAQ